MFECHLTIEPIFGTQLDEAKLLVTPYGFKVAELLLKTRSEDTGSRSAYDTFMTAHHESCPDLTRNMVGAVKVLQASGVRVWRYKIEYVVIDSRISDSLGLL